MAVKRCSRDAHLEEKCQIRDQMADTSYHCYLKGVPSDHHPSHPLCRPLPSQALRGVRGDLLPGEGGDQGVRLLHPGAGVPGGVQGRQGAGVRDGDGGAVLRYRGDAVFPCSG